ncbi:hypothetical protein BV898_06239 [Hypsibius exemplaris]|uniref:Lipase domain-containing protein n=1 Tax=Hypsibius exemplaris TaxID=2072580 RepID=A0A1W0WWY2_HYPEX|nr:hypothetical protein BV898_06239 [Hypsibius exemplaris]
MSLPLFATLCVLLIGSASAAEVCCGGNLGCFNNTGVFYSFLNRPISLLPDCDLISRFRLHLNTRANPTATQVLDPYDLTTVAGSHFSVERETKILIHGFTDNFAWPWWTDMIAALLGDGDFNIIRLDWVCRKCAALHEGHRQHPHRGGIRRKVCQYFGRSSWPTVRPTFTSLDTAWALTFPDTPENGSTKSLAFLASPRCDGQVDTLIADGEPILSLGFGSLQAMGHLNFYLMVATNNRAVALCKKYHLMLWSKLVGWRSSNVLPANRLQPLAALSLYTETIGQQKCLAKAFQCESYAKYLGEFLLVHHGETSVLRSVAPAKAEHSGQDSVERCPQRTWNHFRHIARRVRASARVPLTAEDVELNPGAQLSFLFTIPHDVGLVRDVAIYWEANYSILTPGDWLRKHYLQIDGNLELEHQNGQVILLRPLVRKIEEKKEVFTTATQA